MQYQLKKEDAKRVFGLAGGDRKEITHRDCPKILTLDSELCLIYSNKRWHLYSYNKDVTTLLRYAHDDLRRRILEDFGVAPDRDQLGMEMF